MRVSREVARRAKHRHQVAKKYMIKSLSEDSFFVPYFYSTDFRDELITSNKNGRSCFELIMIYEKFDSFKIISKAKS